VGSLGERIGLVRSGHSISQRELASSARLSYAELVRLEAGGKRRPASDAVARLADFFHTTEAYLVHEQEPAPPDLRATFLHYFERLDPRLRAQLKYAPIQRRVDLALRFLERSYPTLFGRRHVAARLGHTLPSLEDVVSGTAPLNTHLLKRLASLMGLDLDFFVRGDLFGGVEDEDANLDLSTLVDYYQVVKEAISLGVSPDKIRAAVRDLAKLHDRG
jgi:transcriptional regulator with XRE-family HTH domain